MYDDHGAKCRSCRTPLSHAQSISGKTTMIHPDPLFPHSVQLRTFSVERLYMSEKNSESTWTLLWFLSMHTERQRVKRENDNDMISRYNNNNKAIGPKHEPRLTPYLTTSFRITSSEQKQENKMKTNSCKSSTTRIPEGSLADPLKPKVMNNVAVACAGMIGFLLPLLWPIRVRFACPSCEAVRCEVMMIRDR